MSEMQCVATRPVPAMIVSDDGKSAIATRDGKSLVPAEMFAEAMQQLYHYRGFGFRRGHPEPDLNATTVRRRHDRLLRFSHCTLSLDPGGIMDRLLPPTQSGPTVRNL
jgi:hypothetical protein